MRNWKFYRKQILKFYASLVTLLFGFWIQPVVAQESEAVRQLQYAQKLMADGFLDLASTQFDEFLQIYPDSPRAMEALYDWGKCLQKLEKWQESSTKFRQLLFKYPDYARCDEALYGIAENQLSLEETSKAINSLERFPLFYPKSKLAAQALLKAGDLNHAKFNYTKAEENWLRIVNEFSTSIWVETARMNLAQLYFHQNKFDQAEVQVDRLLESKPAGSIAARLTLLKAKITANKYRLDETQNIYDQLRKSNLSNEWKARVDLDFADFLQKIGELDRAKQLLDPLNESGFVQSLQDSIRLQKILYLSQVEEDTLALDVIDQILQSSENPNTIISALSFGIKSAKKTKNDQVLVHYLEQILDLEKENELEKPFLKKTHLDLVQSYQEMGRPASSIEIAHVALNRFTHDELFLDRVRYVLGRVYLETLNQPRQALFYFERILRPSAKSELADDAAFQLAKCYKKLSDQEQEIGILQNIIQSYPGSPFQEKARSRLNWYKYYKPSDPSAELSRMSTLFSNLLLTAQRDESIFALIQQMFNQLRAYRELIKTNKIIRNKNLLRNYTDQLDQMVADSYYRLAFIEEDLPRKETLLDSARMYYLQYLASPPTRKEQLRVALLLQKMDDLRKQDHAPNLNSVYVFYTTLINKFTELEEIDLLKLELANVLLKIGIEGVPDSIHSAIKIYDEIQNNGNKAYATNGSISNPFDPEFYYSTVGEIALYRNGIAHLAIEDTTSCDSLLLLYKFKYPKGSYILEAINQLTDISVEQEKWDYAEQYLAELSNDYFYSARSRSARLQLAEIKISQNKYEDALEILVRMSDDYEIDFEKKQFLHGLALKEISDYFQSRQVFQDYLQAFPNGRFISDVYLHLADIGKRMNQAQELQLNYERFLNRYPSDVRSRGILHELADERFKHGEYRTALDQYKELFAGANDLDEQKLLERKRIICMIRLGRVSGAQVELTQFDKTYKDAEEDIAEIEYELGDHYLREKYFEGAEKTFKRVSDKFKKTRFGPYGEYGLGKLKLITNKTEEGLEILSKIVSKYPDSDVLPNMYVTLGDFYYKNKQLDIAVGAFQRCLEHNPDSPTDITARRYLIKLYTDRGSYDVALLAIREYVDKYPDSENIFNYKISLGTTLMRLFEYDRAIDHFRSLLPIANNEQEAEIRFHIAESYSNIGQFRKSISEYLKVPYYTSPTKLPWHVTAEYRAALAYMKLQEWDPAKLILEKIVKREGLESVFGASAQKSLDEINLHKENN